MQRIGVISQKGGVGKSTIAREIARQFAQSGWRVKIADLDTKQTTSTDWNSLRRDSQLTPDISVEAYKTLDQTKGLSGFDLLVFDGKPHSDKETMLIAQVSDLLVIPTGATLDDLRPQIKLAYELEDIAKIPKHRIIFILNHVTGDLTTKRDGQVVDSPEVDSAKKAIQSAGYEVVSQPIPRRLAYQNAQNSGRSLSEVTHPSLSDIAAKAVTEIAQLLQKEPA